MLVLSEAAGIVSILTHGFTTTLFSSPSRRLTAASTNLVTRVTLGVATSSDGTGQLVRFNTVTGAMETAAATIIPASTRLQCECE
jgi:hypothetical protein